MKKTTFVKFICVLVAVFTLATVGFAAGFTKTLSYADGSFSDVKSTSWYAKEVASAYELGFMNGKGEGTFAPDGNVTVAEAITMASRVHAIYNGKEIAKTEGKWYDMYVQYALANGIIAEGQYTNFDRNIMRYEMAVMFADAMPASYFEAKNDVKAIPDVDKAEEYHDKLMMLYKAGVVMGSTEYGDFLATNSIKRSETAAIINRVALPENRLSKTLKEYGVRNEAVYLIDNHSMTRTVRNRNFIASGWRYENTIDTTRDDTDFSTNVLSDTSEIGHAAMHRDVTTQTHGVVVLEFKCIEDNPGFKMVISDINGNNMLSLISNADKTYSVMSDIENTAPIEHKRGLRSYYFEFDLDNRRAKIVVDGKDIGGYDLSKTATDISRISFLTGDKEKLHFTLNEIYMYSNFAVNDAFRTTPFGSAPYGWITDGAVTVESQMSDLDNYSVRMTAKAKANKEFKAVSGKFVYETFVKIPEAQSMVLSLKNNDETLASVKGTKGEFLFGDTLLKSYTPGIWQLVRIEGDSEKDSVVIKINNKECHTAKISFESVDEIEISSEGVGFCYFDDVKLYNVYDYADYCPVPNPVTDDEWYVGMSICSLWREGTHYGWDCISPYEEATPVIGYYDEGLAEVADWEIKMLVEHGYDFQHFCWYIGNSGDGIKSPRLSHALHGGFMNAKYSYMQDFMLMWENANGGTVSDFNSFKNVVWNYWCDWYFTDERYFTIDNKPVLTIYQYQEFITQLGGEEEAIKAIKFMKEDIKKLGYDGMIILFCDHGSSKTGNALMKKLGGDAFICYNFGEDSYNPEYQFVSMNTAYKNGGIPLMPSVSVGFNDLGWTETRTPLATPEAYKEVLEWSRDDYMKRLENSEKEAWKSRFVIGNTWNEYGEGHYIMPSNVCGFGYIDANRQVFSSVAGKDDKSHFDVTATINQKKRLSYLYPNRTQLIRRTHLVTEDVDFENDYEVVKGWNFENKTETFMWTALYNTTAPVFSDNEKALVGRSYNNDPSITLISTNSNYLDADKIQYMKVRMKYDEDVVSNITLYFRTEDDKEYAQIRGVSTSVGGTSEYKDYYIDLSSNKFWKGTVTNIRFDPSACEGAYSIKSIEFLGKKHSDDFVINVDGKSMYTSNLFVKKISGEIFVAGNPSSGFYSLHNFYTEWNRHNGTLMLKTGTGYTFNFTVGSDIVLVDGERKNIASNFEVLDGLPFIPLKFVYDNADIKYKQTSSGFDVEIRGGNIKEVLERRVENEYEFNIENDYEGWNVGAGSAMVSSGFYVLTATQTSSSRYDPQMSNTKVSINTKLYNSVKVRVKPLFDEEISMDSLFTIYFATDKNTKLNENKTSKRFIKDLVRDEEGFYTIEFDFSEHNDWDGTVTTLRFDPPNSAGVYYIDYIRVLQDEEALSMLTAELEAKELLKTRLLQADEGKPFYIGNPDAEDKDYLQPSHDSYVKLKIVEDDLKKGNHAFELVPVGTNKNWAYTMIPTRFKPGVTYKVEFDIRVTKDHTGADVDVAVLSWNLRYADLSNGSFKQMADHHANIGKFGTKDGWQHVSFTHKISQYSELRENDYFAIFANPIELPDGSYRNIGYMIDNISVSVVN